MKDVFTTGQVARICNVTIRTVIKWFDNGKLKGYRIPGSRDRRIPRAALVEFLKEHHLPHDAAGLLGKPKLLVADDEAEVASFLEGYFRDTGIFDVFVARSGYEAGFLTAKHRPDMVLLDYHLGDMNGLEVIQFIRKEPAHDGVRILIMSGYLSDEQADAIRATGYDVVKKPFKIEDLRQRIYSALRIIG